jgi:protein SCO1/2
MPAMTMSYRLEDPSALSELHPGDLITATLLADRDAAGPKNLRLKEIVVIAQARPDYKPKVQYHVPATGDVVPNFTLLNQSDRTISLKQFRGKVVVMTFIYTRCPLSDFCPRMSRNFAEIDKALAADPALYGKTHLLSVSFDPTYDTPKVLRSYGSAYTGQYVKETFQHWDFAAPSVAELPKMEQYFDVGVTPGESGTLQHSLSTIVIGKEGKVIAFYPTNDWTPAQILAQIHTAAA